MLRCLGVVSWHLNPQNECPDLGVPSTAIIHTSYTVISCIRSCRQGYWCKASVISTRPPKFLGSVTKNFSEKGLSVCSLNRATIRDYGRAKDKNSPTGFYLVVEITNVTTGVGRKNSGVPLILLVRFFFSPSPRAILRSLSYCER